MNICAWIKKNALDVPRKICIRDADQEISYEEIFRAVNAFAAVLLKHGVEKGDRVLISLANTPEFVIAYMATLWCGGIAVPVHPLYTPYEFHNIISDCEPAAAIIEAGNSEKITLLTSLEGMKHVSTTGEKGSFHNALSAACSSGTYVDTDDHDTAVIIYSYGIHGYPMGAMLTHGNLNHNAEIFLICFGVDASDVSLGLIPFFHAFGASQVMLTTLKCGGTLQLQNGMNINNLAATLKRGISVITAVPKTFYALARHPAFKDLDFRQVKLLLSGGSCLPLTVYRDFKTRFGKDIRQGYGLTEASPACTMNRAEDLRPDSIGTTVSGVEVRIVDEQDRTVGCNEIGELIFRGPNVMKGYYKRPVETGEIIRDGWLYTGDLGYRDERQNLVITGMKKEMLITSGYNVYPGEIESALRAHPQIAEAKVVGLPDVMSGEVPAAYIVRTHQSLDVESIKSFLSHKFIHYKIPRRIKFINSISEIDDRSVSAEADKAHWIV